MPYDRRHFSGLSLGTAAAAVALASTHPGGRETRAQPDRRPRVVHPRHRRMGPGARDRGRVARVPRHHPQRRIGDRPQQARPRAVHRRWRRSRRGQGPSACLRPATPSRSRARSLEFAEASGSYTMAIHVDPDNAFVQSEVSETNDLTATLDVLPTGGLAQPPPDPSLVACSPPSSRRGAASPKGLSEFAGLAHEETQAHGEAHARAPHPCGPGRRVGQARH